MPKKNTANNSKKAEDTAPPFATPCRHGMGGTPRDSANAANPWFEMWSKYMESFPSNPDSGQNWFKMCDEMTRKFCTPPLTDGMDDLYQKVADASDIYIKMFKSWADISGNVKPSRLGGMKNMFDLLMNSQKDVFSRLFGLPTPDFAGGNIGEWTETARKSLENFSQFYFQNCQPFIDNWSNISTEMGEMLKGKADPEKYKNFYATWVKGYESAVGKFLKIPSVGPSRQILDKINKSLDAFIKYCGAISDFNMVLYAPGKETIEEFAKKSAAIAQDGQFTQEKYKQFYDLLINTFEERFYQMFKTPAFGEILKTTLEASLNFRKQHFAVVEELLKSTPIITRSEIDDVYRELYDLKKRIKELEKLINNRTNLPELTLRTLTGSQGENPERAAGQAGKK
ncbi:MAG: hypothetical protein HY762_09705 [Planctomycetes bacterium]|nr:hypothetical protein [Planctomycetota bacterium]